jgi:hypothetical protein
MKQKTRRFALLIIISLLLIGFLPTAVMAYFDRGQVSVEAGQPAVTVEEGGSVTVNVNVTPASDSQLPGCGMTECPQSCGEGCLNKDGECTCDGLQYKTYYADVQAATSDASVATVRYSSGVVIIKGIAPGEATITITGMLRQYQNGSQTVKVTVAAKTTANAAAVTATSAAGQKTVAVPAGNPVVKPVEIKPVGEPPASDAAQQNQGDIRTVMSDHGLILFVPLQEGNPMGKAQLAKIMGRQESVTFEKTDAAGNVLYSWTFAGKDLTAPADIDMTIEISKQGTEELQRVTGGKEALYLAFSHEGPLPGPATVCVNVNDIFANGSKLNLYYYDEKNSKAQLQAENLPVENGYVNIPLKHCSQYILMEGSLDSAAGMIWTGVIMAVAAVVLLLIVLLVVEIKRKQKVIQP